MSAKILDREERTLIKIGIDPGTETGGLAIINGSDIKLFTIPSKEQIWGARKKDKKGFFRRPMMNDAVALKGLILEHTKGHEIVSVNVELVHSMPKDGVASTFKFGRSFQSVIAVCEMMNLSYKMVDPVTWRSKFNLIKKSKEDVRKFCIKTFPQTEPYLVSVRGVQDQKICQGRADSLLIGLV